MRILPALLVMAGLILAGCGFGQSRLNPFNWFGDSRETVSEVDPGSANPLIPETGGGLLDFGRGDETYEGVPIARITELQVEQVVGGAIIRAEGIASRQGAFEPRLVPATEDERPVDGVLSYTFSVLYPPEPTQAGPERSRKVLVARTLSDQALEGVRVVRVSGVENARESRRR